MLNEQNNSKNALLVSFAGIGQQIGQVIWTFVYRTIFLFFLSKEHLGINGLFSNIFQIFSLVELGIGGTILYRMYKPLAEKDIKKIGEYIKLYGKIYHILFCVIIFLGILIYPLIGYIIEESQVPIDVDIKTVYILFVLQSACSYLFVYHQSIVLADQKGYEISLLNLIIDFAVYTVRIIALIWTKDYITVLAFGVMIQIFINYTYSIIIKKRYRMVFDVKSDLEKDQVKAVFKDTAASMCHKIGSIVVTSTDNIILTKICGLSVVGIYSNYAVIISSVIALMGKMIGNFTPIIGNCVLRYTREEIYSLYKRMDFINLWISGITTICLYVLLNIFVGLWLNETFLLDQLTVSIICLQYYLQTTKIITNTFINACGLFVMDKIRPLIESILNLLISVICGIKWGVIGVFIGTCFSGLLTYYWREPYLLFKEILKISPKYFIKGRIKWAVMTLVMCFIGEKVIGAIPMTWSWFVIAALGVFVWGNIVFVVSEHKNDEFIYFKDYFVSRIYK